MWEVRAHNSCERVTFTRVFEQAKFELFHGVIFISYTLSRFKQEKKPAFIS